MRGERCCGMGDGSRGTSRSSVLGGYCWMWAIESFVRIRLGMYRWWRYPRRRRRGNLPLGNWYWLGDGAGVLMWGRTCVIREAFAPVATYFLVREAFMRGGGGWDISAVCSGVGLWDDLRMHGGGSRVRIGPRGWNGHSWLVLHWVLRILRWVPRVVPRVHRLVDSGLVGKGQRRFIRGMWTRVRWLDGHWIRMPVDKGRGLRHTRIHLVCR